MPTKKQMEKLAAAAAVGRSARTSSPVCPTDDMPSEYWAAVLDDAATDAGQPGSSIRMLRLSQIQRHVLRVCCRRFDRIVEIQKADAVRMFGQDAVWKKVAQQLLDDTCQHRSGRYEEDGCWPAF